MNKEEALEFLSDYLGAWEPEHSVPFQIVYDKIVDGKITDYSMHNILEEINNEKQRLGWRM
ncbi:MAG: hypothetical protein HGA35_05900 [Erysipelotrichaceae bacterium]|nr:hypothetical protein [Erysipelotrichaceae bacterium]